MQEVLWLYARGPEEQVRRWPLSAGRWVVGREKGVAGQLEIPWDKALSRRHFELECRGRMAEVRLLATASNPVFWQGRPEDEFTLQAGEHFVAGKTRFQLLLRGAEEVPESAMEFTLAHGARQRLHEQRAGECLQALTLLLPRLRAAADLAELWEAALGILASLLPAATRIIPLRVFEDGTYSVEQARAAPYTPSKRLLRLAFDTGKTAIHQWSSDSDDDMTVSTGMQWALATPILVSAKERYALYAVGVEDPGTGEGERALIDLVGEALGHFLATRRADRIQAHVGQFFSPSLRNLLDEQGLGRLLEPARKNVSVMFFDLRGFSKATEQAEGDQLDAVLEHHALLTEVMSMATECIFAHDGIVLDFAGDAIMAGWGAPADQPDHAERSVRAAVDIVTAIQSMTLPFESPGGLRCGLGLASGEVIAGQQGGRDQIKYGWMGAVVNQAARLEGMTKYFGVPILITGPLRAMLGEQSDLRRIGVARPAGMTVGVELYEVVIPKEVGGSGLTVSEIESYERAEKEFVAGNMFETIKCLREVPVEDPVARFLTRQAYRYEESGLPDEWHGLIEFQQK